MQWEKSGGSSEERIISTQDEDSGEDGENGKICGFFGGDYEEWHLLGCYAVWIF
jgi:hypothetical protein